MCGEAMRLCVRDVRDRLPGGGDASARILREWTCPECDYFEEADDERQEGSAGAERQQ